MFRLGVVNRCLVKQSGGVVPHRPEIATLACGEFAMTIQANPPHICPFCHNRIFILCGAYGNRHEGFFSFPSRRYENDTDTLLNDQGMQLYSIGIYAMILPKESTETASQPLALRGLG